MTQIETATAIIDRHIDFYEIDEKERCLVRSVLEVVRKNYGVVEHNNLIQDFGMQNFGLRTIL